MKIVSIYDAKTNFSKYVKQAEAGAVIYVGAYGKAQAVIAPLPKKKKFKLGVGKHLADPNFDYSHPTLVGSDPEIVKMFEDSANKDFPL